MSTTASRRIRLLGRFVALVALAAFASTRAAAAAPTTFHAVPPVQVIELAASGSASGTITLRNDSSASVVAGSITAAPGCDAAAVQASPLTGFTLASGQTRPITIMCTPAPASMQRCGYQVLSTLGSVLAEFEAVCAYAGSPTLAPDTTAIDFGPVAVGGSVSQTIVLHNTAAQSLARMFVELTDPADNFAVAAPCNPDARECDAAIPVVSAGGTTNLVVTCTPRSAGPQAAQLYVATSAGTQLAAPIPLSCTGTTAITPVLSASPGAITAGTVEVIGATARVTVHLANAGAGPLQLLDVQIVDGGTGAAADWTFAARAPCTSGIPPSCALTDGQTVDLDLVFDPSAIGVRDTTLLINFHDTADRSLSVPLHGIGAGATLELVGGQAILDFGVLPLNTTGTLTFQVANHGTRNLADATPTATPAGPPFTVTPSPTFAVTTAAPAVITVACKPTAAGMFTTDLTLAAPDVGGPTVALTLRCAGDPALTLTATPPAILLGEVRTASQLVQHVAIASTGAPASLTSATLEAPQPALTLGAAPAMTPATIDLTVAPSTDGNLADRLLVKPASGPSLAIPITGGAATAMYSVPAAVSLGTFCVQQPTTPRILPLVSTGTASIGLSSPALQLADSPFDLELVAPLTYPTTLAPLQQAFVTATPKRRAVAGLASDDLVWTTDVDGATTTHTTLTATFVDNGGAIAPPAIAFDPAPVHLETRNAHQITLQNCDVSPLQLDKPQISAPFSIDSPTFPNTILPGETATFSVGFHPTQLGPATQTLVITSPQRPNVQLTVLLTGKGIVTDPVGDAGAFPPPHPNHCGNCASSDPSGALALTLAALSLLAPRRRERPPR